MAVAHARGDEGTRVAAVVIASAAGLVLAGPDLTATGLSDVVAAIAVGALAALGAVRSSPPARALAGAALAAALVGPVGAVLVLLAVFLPVVQVHLGTGRWSGALLGAAAAQIAVRLVQAGRGADAGLAVLALVVLVASNLRQTTGGRGWRRGLAVGAGLVGVATLGFVASVLLARADVTTATQRADDGLAAARRGQSERAGTLLSEAAQSFEGARDDLGAWWSQPARLLPVLGPQAEAMEVLAGEGAWLARAAATAAVDADVDDLRVVDGRVDLEQVRRMAAPLDSVDQALDRAATRVTDADSAWLLPPVAGRIESFAASIDRARYDVRTAAEAIDVMPELLGADEARTYFVAFGTPAESRELGGFMGAYALLGAEDGKVTLGSTGRVRNLNQFFSGQQLEDRSAFPDHYLAMVPQVFWHNVTGTADFPTVAEAVRQLWRPPRTNGRIDGVIYMDPATLADLLGLTGPVRVPGRDEPLTERNATDFLLRGQYEELPAGDRHDFLADAAASVFDSLTTGELPAPRDIADALRPSVRARRLLVSSFDAQEQAVLERLRLDGGMPASGAGDLLSVRSSNRGLNKLDAYLRRSHDYEVRLDPATGRVDARLTTNLVNEAPDDGLPADVAVNRLGHPPGTNSTTLVIYSPFDLAAIEQDGEPVGVGATSAMDLNRYSVLIDLPPGASTTVVLELEGRVDPTDGYRLAVVPQPLANADQLRVRVWTGGPLPAGALDRRLDRVLEVEVSNR